MCEGGGLGGGEEEGEAREEGEGGAEEGVVEWGRGGVGCWVGGGGWGGEVGRGERGEVGFYEGDAGVEHFDGVGAGGEGGDYWTYCVSLGLHVKGSKD